MRELGSSAEVPIAARVGRLTRRSPSDGALVRAAQAGSDEAVESLFARHWPDAYRAAYLIARDRAAAEDIAQEAFLAAVRALPRFDHRRPLRPWLHRIVVNRAIDWSRARALRGEVGIDGVPEQTTRTGATAPLGDDVVGALATLSAEHRAVIVLRYVLDFTPGEIARALGLARGTVNSRLRRGLDVLGALLDEEAL
ncbi:MAG TPA: RNA polymerase sigma factor [Solirubrobacteraceae bacterium]|nr:RNA polymerase sigma factor [Solirubrobacteraceae bacterium]